MANLDGAMMTTTPTAPITLDAAPGVESCVAALAHALQREKGWLHGYADSIIRDAIDRVHLDAAPEIAAIREALAAVCIRCGGDGMDPLNDYLFECPDCNGRTPL
jgi:hypothetical protein